MPAPAFPPGLLAFFFRLLLCFVKNPILLSALALRASNATPSATSPGRGPISGRAATHVTGRSCTSRKALLTFMFSRSKRKTDPSTLPSTSVEASPDRDREETGFSEHSARAPSTKFPFGGGGPMGRPSGPRGGCGRGSPAFGGASTHRLTYAGVRFPDWTVYTTFPSRSPNAQPLTKILGGPRWTLPLCGFFFAAAAFFGSGSSAMHFICPSSEPERPSHNRAVPSLEPLSTARTRGWKATEETAPSCPSPCASTILRKVALPASSWRMR
mmetsp:Transcript_28651/g.84420  ORF Transcript_28651/g.84420 Transcript_28651/m.84420 type:complete len:271 (-) Transcript_28651:1135-1947(-)